MEEKTSKSGMTYKVHDDGKIELPESLARTIGQIGDDKMGLRVFLHSVLEYLGTQQQLLATREREWWLAVGTELTEFGIDVYEGSWQCNGSGCLIPSRSSGRRQEHEN